MATPVLYRSSSSTLSKVAIPTHARPRLQSRRSPNHQLTRTFLSSSPFSPPTSTPDNPQILTASRTLPHAALPLFDIVADIASYPTFLPFCRAARITRSSEPDAVLSRTWPARAGLSVGYGDAATEFESFVYCAPPSGKLEGIVEAVSGGTKTLLPRDRIAHYASAADKDSRQVTEGPLSHLRTVWTLREQARTPGGQTARTDVTLRIEFAFKSMIFDVMSRAATPKVADMMVGAFVKRVDEVLGTGSR